MSASTGTFFRNVDSYLEHLDKELNSFAQKHMDKIAKEALEAAVELPAEDMEYEFDVKHNRTGNTTKSYKTTKPRKDNATASYIIKSGYQKNKGTGFVALFFDYGTPYMDSAKSKSSEGFVGRAFGVDEEGNTDSIRGEMIQGILEKRVRKGIEAMQDRLNARAKKT